MPINLRKTFLNVETTYIEIEHASALIHTPASEEIVVALGASVGGRPHHRIGDRYQDLKDLGHDVSNPAAV